jgi:transitional endoplasmic reticulum ATPase
MERDYRLRPELRILEYGGHRVEIIDVPGILAAASGARVDLLRGGAFEPPVHDVRFSIAHDRRDEDRYVLLDASIATGSIRSPRLTATALGSDPLSVLLGRRVAAGDRWATRLVDGMTAIADQVSHRLRTTTEPADEPVPTVERVAERRDGPTGLSATATYWSVTSATDPRVTLRAVVPEEEMSEAPIEAMIRLLIDEINRLAGPPAAAVRTLVVTAAADAERQVTLDQVGGLDNVVRELREIAVSFRHPDVMARWGARRPQGVLMYGPPGTGKTMLARALAHEIGARFEEIHTPDILDKWLGASERNIKRIFRDARRYRQPTVMLFDEFDSIIGYAGEGGDSASQAINAVAGIFKQEMNDLIDENPLVIVVATTNFPQRVDASLIRSGRFDIKLSVPVPDRAGRAEILAKAIRRLIAAHETGEFEMFADDVDVDKLAVESHGMTGADLVEVLRRAQLAKAMQEARTDSPARPISQADLLHQVDRVRAQAVST